jgi:hypothetical protein
VDANEPAIVKVDVGLAKNGVDANVGVESKLRATSMNSAIPVRRRMRGRAPVAVDGRLAWILRQDNPMAGGKRDDDRARE